MISKWMLRAVTGVAVVLLSGCSMIDDPVSLMKEPDLPAEKATLMSAINAAKPQDSSIIRPRSDDDPSSIRIEDLNNDGSMETVVFYKTAYEKVQIHGMILEQQGTRWVKKLDFDGEGDTLESFDLIDITNDGKKDIVAGFSMSEAEQQKGMVVYTYSGDSLEAVLEMPYTQFEVTDLNQDKIQELTVVSLQPFEYSNITVYQYEDGTKQELAKLDLGPNIDSYYNIIPGKVAEDKEGIVLDTSIVSSSSTTKMIVMHEGVLVDVLKEDAAYKELPVDSEDVNGDGIIEIGLLEVPVGWENRAPEDIPYLQSYYQWDGKTPSATTREGLTFVMQKYQDSSNRFFVNFPTDWNHLVTLHPDSDKNSYLNFVRIENGESVAEVKFFTLPEWERAKDEWKVLVRQQDQVIGYKGDLARSKNEKKSASDVAPIERKGN